MWLTKTACDLFKLAQSTEEDREVAHPDSLRVDKDSDTDIDID